MTVGQPGGMMGPPTCGTTPVTIGQVCMSPARAAGGISEPLQELGELRIHLALAALRLGRRLLAGGRVLARRLLGWRVVEAGHKLVEVAVRALAAIAGIGCRLLALGGRLLTFRRRLGLAFGGGRGLRREDGAGRLRPAPGERYAGERGEAAEAHLGPPLDRQERNEML